MESPRSRSSSQVDPVASQEVQVKIVAGQEAQVDPVASQEVQVKIVLVMMRSESGL